MTDGPTPVLAVSGLSVDYGGVRALDDASFTVAPGEIVGLIGPNGAGKTTCIDAITGFAVARTGRVTLGDTEMCGLAPHRLARAGLSDAPFHGVFIRAPAFDRLGPSVEVVATLGDVPVAVVAGSVVATTFHPELTADPRLHEFALGR